MSANSCMNPTHPQEHLIIKHKCHVGNPTEFFKRKHFDLRASKKAIKKSLKNIIRSTRDFLCDVFAKKAKKTFTTVDGPVHFSCCGYGRDYAGPKCIR